MGKDFEVDLSNIGLNLGGGLDLDLDEIRIKELPAEIPVIRLGVTELPKIRSDLDVDLDADLDVDADVDLGLDDIRIREIAPICLEVGLKPTRVHLPVHLTFCLGLLGLDLLSFSVCGESMVVVEDYQPHHTELCR